MRPILPPFSVRAALFAFLLAVATLWQCDRALHMDDPPVIVAPVAPARAGVARDPAPVFVLVVDSLRWETAMDPAIMPALAALRHEGAWAKMNTVYQGHTVPAMRAIFTGGTTSGVFNVITDFRRSNLRLASLFSELQSAGRISAAWSSGQFAQFGTTPEQRFVHPFSGDGGGGSVYQQRDRRRVVEALRTFAEGRHALVIGHVEFTDYEAHQFGVGPEGYRRAFADADTLVALAARSVPPSATLVVIGDHGHDARGAHKAGLDIPTTVVARGPAFRAGFDLGTIEITDAGYLLRAGLKAPANRGRQASAALDRSLVAGAEPPMLGHESITHRPGRLAFGQLAACALLAAAGWRLWWRPGWREQTAAWLGLGVALLPGAVAPWIAVALAGAALAEAVRGGAGRGVTFGVAALAGALVGAGTLLSHAAGLLPPEPVLLRGALILVAVLAWRRSEAERGIWLAVAAAVMLWLVEPWQHAAGWWGATLFAGLGLVWLTLTPIRRDPLAALGVTVVALTFATFYRADAAGHWAFATPITMEQIIPFAIAGGAAKLLVLYGVAPKNWRGFVVSLLGAAALGAYAWQVDRSSLDWHPRIAGAGLIVLFGVAWLVARWAGARSWTPVLGLAALFALLEHGVRAQPFHFAWADGLFAGFFLAARLATTDTARAALGAGGVAFSFALVQGWHPGGVEWQALYDWFPAEEVEMHVGWFLPWILFRETLPLWIVRAVVVTGSGRPWPGVAVARIGAAWMLGLVLLLAGHYAVSPEIATSQLPAEQLAGIGLLVFAALAGRTGNAAAESA